MDRLIIEKKVEGKETVLQCTGRLDANHATHLNDAIDMLVREGHYLIALDLLQVEYLSSAGIRTLVNQYKKLRTVNGYLYLLKASENVVQVLDMVGLYKMLATKPLFEDEEIEEQESKPKSVTLFGYTFQLANELSGREINVSYYGNPRLIFNSAYTAEDGRKFDADENHYAFGLGAIGHSFDECRKRFGEFIMLGKNIAYLPSDRSGKPDYMVSSGKLVASLTELYGIHFKGSFSQLIRFDGEQGTSICLSEIAQGVIKMMGFKRFAMIMVAESAGLVGASLNASPVGGSKIFSFPEVRQTINFTTEPVHNKMLSVSVGYFSQQDDLPGFVREMSPESKLYGHVHAAVFPYMPLKKKEIDLNETINGLFNDSELTDILHLTNDAREINGLGESRFVQGFCWVAPACISSEDDNLK